MSANRYLGSQEIVRMHQEARRKQLLAGKRDEPRAISERLWSACFWVLVMVCVGWLAVNV